MRAKINGDAARTDGRISTDKTEQDVLREAFVSSNSIASLSFGRLPSKAELELQERVIVGDLTFDQAVKIVVARASTLQLCTARRSDE